MLPSLIISTAISSAITLFSKASKQVEE